MDFKTLLNQISLLIQHLSLKQRIVAGISVFTVIAFLTFLVFFKSPSSEINDGYSILFDNTSPTDSALIIQQLEKDKIPYKVINEGTIAVPSDVVYKERIAISALGIPKNSKIGFEIFDKTEFGATDFEQKIKYLRALEGELSRTIEGLVPIQNATVHIAIPKDTVFAEKKLPATASVVVDIKQGMKLTNKQITGIKNLIASSVTNLSPKDVTIVDQNGVSLGEAEGAFSSDLLKSQIKYKKDYESNIEDKIISVLAPVIGGIDKVVAKVTVDFDFKQENSTSEIYDPNSVPRSEQTIEEKREGTSPKEVGGVPGAVSNIGPVQGVTSNQKTEKYQKSSTTTNYEISKKVVNVKDEFATIKRISAAVVVDGNYELQKDANGDENLKYVPLTKEQLAQIEQIVKQTVGYDKKRGDEVTVSNFEFKPLTKDGKKPPTQTFIEKASFYLSPISPLFKYLFVILVLFIFYKKVILPFMERMLQEQLEEEEEDSAEPLDEEDLAEDTLERFKKAKKRVEEQLGIGDDFNEDELRYEVLLEKLKAQAEQHPEDIASLLQGLINNSDFNNQKNKDL